MGLLGDYRATVRSSRQLAARQDVAASLSTMQRRMEQLNASLAPRASGLAVAHGVAASATITAVVATGAVLDLSPVWRIDLLVVVPGRPPRPVTHVTAVPQTAVHRARPGASVAVRVMIDDPEDLYIDWAT